MTDGSLEANLTAIRRRTDQMFFWLLLVQWACAIGLAAITSPFGWEGNVYYLHIHFKLAILLGGAINLAPLYLIRRYPGTSMTRHVVAAAQMLWSALLIMITDGRIETHFHVFGSLAFLAFYRDWKLFPTATLVLAADHLARGVLWPESVYGIANPEWWRFLEHAVWIVFEDVLLMVGCQRSIADMREVAGMQARLREESEFRQARLREEAELRHAQRLASVGRLASGVAHEINTPVQFVGDSVSYLQDAVADLLAVIDKHQIETPEIARLRKQLPEAFELSFEGLQRIAKIVRSMKQFARPDSAEVATIDLNAAIDSTLTVARQEYTAIADVVTELAELPYVRCFPRDINAVVHDMIVNAAHAIGDANEGTGARGTISIATRRDDDHVVIDISDTGTGIPEEIRDRIFDPFFTTKAVGKGTGQGLAIARSVVVDKHQGSIDVDSKPGLTRFRIRIPIEGPAYAA